jgi:ParB family transcriptional regulator, chromosome partitioning protein
MTDSTPSSTKNFIDEVELEFITTDKNQPRKSFDPDSLKELAKSIEEHGIIQPIILRKDDGKNIIVAGERRFRAAKQANLAIIPAIFTKGKPAEIALVENLLRDDLTPLEEARAMDRLLKKEGYNNKKIATFLGKGESTISSTLSILKLSPKIREDLDDGEKAPKRILIAIAALKDNKAMAGAWRKYKNSQTPREGIKKKDDDKRSKPDKVLLRFAGSVSKSLGKLDIAELEGDSKDKVRDSLKKLEQEIKDTLVKLDG